ncbi:patatin-like phospholipase family protein [Actinoplanes sp. LDG1-06]|uniref:Patatin-like phospholipase family protein n=1 Tax=Paractinoplanes ovalisporus TaxID=2810368 RepID=A0ABS2A933_9ACTN|nr:patatin-like phospholipase family protein [Actinoplanes ovalisporus]MBM2616350.1 patatin-like phospholipase family protein [Actinoplanes ovalisporus]
MSGKRVGLVLGGGGILGAAWMIGGLAALQERIGRPLGDCDVIVGTSAGSIVAAALRLGLSPDQLVAHQLGEGEEHLPGAHEFQHDSGRLPPPPRARFGSVRMVATAALAPHSVHPRALASAFVPQGRAQHHALRRYLETMVRHQPDHWPERDTWIVGVDYERGRRVVFGRPGGPPASLPDAVVASCSIPGWHAPTTIGDRRYVDGGVRSVVSLDLLHDQRLDDVYVLAPMASYATDRPCRPSWRAERALRQAFAAQVSLERRKVERAGTRVTVITPGPDDLPTLGINLMDGRRRDDVLRTAQVTIPATLSRSGGR